mgnify:CR=1
MQRKIAITTTSFGKYDSEPMNLLRRNGFERIEELPCWQVARKLCKVVFELINNSKLKMS